MKERQAWIVGGGIASLAAATLLARDGHIDGSNIHVIEQSSMFGGSLDGTGSPIEGYLIRGGRMFEPHFACTFDLFDSIPAGDGSARSVSQTIRDFTKQVVPSSNCRLVRGGQRVEAPALQLNLRNKLDLARLNLKHERSLGSMTIEQYFQPTFFETNFWMMWCSMFAFQPWHSVIEFRRYMKRFMHLMPGFNRLEGIMRTPLNQYDSLVVPLMNWLHGQGVDMRSDSSVIDINFDRKQNPTRVTAINILGRDEATKEIIEIGASDLVMVTLGSMTENSTIGTHNSPAVLNAQTSSGAWDLWRSIASHSAKFGRPDVFCSQVDQTKWQSFTVTLQDTHFFDFIQTFTGNTPGTGGLVTFVDSNWRMSVVLAYQPHFTNQPNAVQVFWGYGLFPDQNGNCVRKPMSLCSGEEILIELLHHLKCGERYEEFFASANCIPCQMPYITSQFMPRNPGDRPAVIPDGSKNFAFLGQYCELPRDTVFTVEYSVRTAQTAVYELLGLDRQPIPIYRGDLNPGVVLRASKALAK